MSEEIAEKAKALYLSVGLDGVNIIPRVKNFIPGNPEHNAKHPLDKIHFEFKSIEDRDKFAEHIRVTGGEGVVRYHGFGKGYPPQPIVQLDSNFVASYKSPVKAFDFADEEIYFNRIIKDFLHTRAFDDSVSYPGQYPGNEGPDQIQRVKHGGMHASRTALHTQKISSLLAAGGYEPAVNLTPKDLFLIKVAAMFHDTGRGMDSGQDLPMWELNGAEKAQKWLLENGFSQHDADKVFAAIAFKDNKEVQASNVYALVLASADSLDWVRSHSSNFQPKFMPEIIKRYIPEQTLAHLGVVAKQIANAQGDAPRAHHNLPGYFSIAAKKGFEHSPNGCYTAVKAAYTAFSSELDKVTLPQKENKHFVSPIKKQETLVHIDPVKDKFASSQVKAALREAKDEFGQLLNQLNLIHIDLAKRAKAEVAYPKITQDVERLKKALEGQKVFFDKPSAERFKQFKSQCQHALNTVEKEAKNHRGWHKIDPVIRGFLGVLAALSVIGAIIVAATSKHGYSQTFFGKPETETSQKVTLFKQKYADHLEHVEEVVHSGMEPK